MDPSEGKIHFNGEVQQNAFKEIQLNAMDPSQEKQLSGQQNIRLSDG